MMKSFSSYTRLALHRSLSDKTYANSRTRVTRSKLFAAYNVHYTPSEARDYAITHLSCHKLARYTPPNRLCIIGLSSCETIRVSSAAAAANFGNKIFKNTVNASFKLPRHEIFTAI